MTRILVVEDEPSISDPLSYLLQREGYEVTVVEDGLEAVEEFDRNGADLVLLDLMLPGQPGTEDRKSTRLNSSHVASSYAVLCVKQKRRTRRTGALHAGAA